MPKASAGLATARPCSPHPTLPKVRPARERRGPDRARRVLVVDDNVDTAELLTTALRQEGHEVAEEHDGLGALVTAASFRPDLVLLDIGLPGMDGFEVTRRFRADPQFANTKIVLNSGLPEIAIRDQFDGYDAFLRKPFKVETLLELVQRFIGR